MRRGGYHELAVCTHGSRGKYIELTLRMLELFFPSQATTLCQGAEMQDRKTAHKCVEKLSGMFDVRARFMAIFYANT